MFHRATRVMALIVDRPTCTPCLALQAALGPRQLDDALAEIARALRMRRAIDRCRGCGVETETVALTLTSCPVTPQAPEPEPPVIGSGA